jgi:hypothetical protein
VRITIGTAKHPVHDTLSHVRFQRNQETYKIQIS